MPPPQAPPFYTLHCFSLATGFTLFGLLDIPTSNIAPPLPCNILSFKNLEIRLKEQTVSCRGQLVTLTHHEFAVLTYLARHPGWVFSASQIYEAVWDRDGEHCGTAVASVIGQIRRKLTPDTPKGGYIRTVPGSGYKFESVI